MTNNYGEQEEYLYDVVLKATSTDDGRVVLANSSLSSADFDGFINVVSASVPISNLYSGQFLKIGTGSADTSYPIISIDREDPELTGSSSATIQYLDVDQQKSISYSSSNTLVTVFKEDWVNKYIGTRGWYISQEGNAIFANIAARGRIEALEGFIGNEDSGWEISANLLSNASVGFYAPSAFSSAEIAIFSGSPFTGRATAPFRVNYGGQMNATGASISGALTATTLNVGGSAGITYDGSIVTIGSSVIINSGLTANSLQVGASPTLLRIANDVEGTNDGIYIDPYNFWYSDGKFSVGGSANSACWNGSALSVKGNIIATSGQFTGSVTAQTITASNGNIAGFTLAKNQLSATNIILSSSGGFRLGNNNEFSVTTNGFLSASSASIVGDSIINGTNIGNGAGNIASNLRIGEGALSNIINVGEYNTAIGASALFSNRNGDNNIAIGENALKSNRDGSLNTAIGRAALINLIDTANNVAIGTGTLNSASAPAGNVAIGEGSLFYTKDASFNVAIGYYSMESSSSGWSNVAIGTSALRYTVDGANVAVGTSALGSGSAIKYNIAVGALSGYNLISGSGNVFIGGYRGPGGTHNNRIYISDGNENQKLTIDENSEATFYGNVIIPSGKNLTVDTNTLFVDGTNNRVGIGIVSPASAFHVTGSALFASNVLVSGQLSANNVNISGSITSASITSTYGEIAGWILSASALTAGTGASTVGFVSTPQSNNIAIYAGNATPSSAPFRVTQTGSAFSTTKATGDSSTSLATTAFVSNMVRYNGAVSPTTASVAGYFVIAVNPGTSLNGAIMIPQGATGRTLNALVDRGINSAASAGYIRGYVESSAGAAIGIGNSVPLYYIAW